MKREVLTHALNVKVRDEVRKAIEKMAHDEYLSIGEVTRGLIEIGLKSKNVKLN
jgi:hypothetical protein